MKMPLRVRHCLKTLIFQEISLEVERVARKKHNQRNTF